MEEIYAGREMRFELHEQGHLSVRMNPSLAASLVSNLLKNAYVHGDKGGTVSVTVAPHELRVCNSSGGGALDAEHISSAFTRGRRRRVRRGSASRSSTPCAPYGLRVG